MRVLAPERRELIEALVAEAESGAITEYLIEKYGMLRKSYLQEHRKGLYL